MCTDDIVAVVVYRGVSLTERRASAFMMLLTTTMFGHIIRVAFNEL